MRSSLDLRPVIQPSFKYAIHDSLTRSREGLTLKSRVHRDTMLRMACQVCAGDNGPSESMTLAKRPRFGLVNTDVEARRSCGRLPRVLSLGLRFSRPSILNPLHLVLAKGFLPYSPAESGNSIFCLLSEEQEALFPRQSSDFCQESAQTAVVFNSSCFARACGTALCLESNPHGDRQLTPPTHPSSAGPSPARMGEEMIDRGALSFSTPVMRVNRCACRFRRQNPTQPSPSASRAR